MKLKNVQMPEFRISGYAVAVSLCLLFCFSLVRVDAQKVKKRITSIWTATSTGGSRVTVASDSQLNDYEAYTRGDRFYVRIPLADLPSTTGSLLGRGFDDVQIHRVGEGILLSFRLQPGTTARVDQKLNRIEVVFSIPLRYQSNLSADRNEVANSTRARTIRDAAGPIPPVSGMENQAGRHAERGARTTGNVRRGNSRLSGEPSRSTTRNSASESSKQKSSREKAVASSLPKAGSTAAAKQPSASESPGSANSSETKGSTTKGPAASASASPSPTPIYSPSPVASPSSSLAVASPTGTPLYTAPVSQQPPSSASPTPGSNSAGKSDWSDRLHYAKTWVRLNPWPLLIGGLIFVALLLLLFVRGGRKLRPRDPAARTERRGATATVKKDSKPVITEPAGVAAGQRRVEASSESSTRSPAVPTHSSEDPDREVFEL